MSNDEALVFNYAENDQADELLALLNQSEDKEKLLSAINVEGCTPLAAATSMNSPAAAKVLLDNGADPKVACPSGRYSGYIPLEIAMQRRYRAMITLLEEVSQ
eukprot:TRINITY_DN1994_c0_g1_i2.p1 TRINITY_DN1994_c0_g1~~TRINITY_DN1994_c0_g1_i2.p1  ORF type:complete len:114 (-),score=32.49 TRINITY_DN1994_c0_g1_i2:149-457(-)